MAINTRNKRASAINPACPWRGLWPRPDGSISAGDRRQTDFLYSGLPDTELGDHILGTVSILPLIRGTVTLNPE